LKATATATSAAIGHMDHVRRQAAALLAKRPAPPRKPRNRQEALYD
jgi:hypothetical protein